MSQSMNNIGEQGRSMKASTLLQFSFCALLIILANHAIALPDDRYQRIDIVSDQARIDNIAGTVIYQGRVNLTQGTLKITADKLVAYRDGNNGIQKIIADGEPARYQQIANPGEPLTKAYGNKIEYYAIDEKLMLFKDAGLTQGENLFTGNEIEYDMKQQKVLATGTQDQKDKDGRIRMVIQPENNGEADDNKEDKN